MYSGDVLPNDLCMAVGQLRTGQVTTQGWQNTAGVNDCPGDDEIWPNPTISLTSKPKLSVWVSGEICDIVTSC